MVLLRARILRQCWEEPWACDDLSSFLFLDDFSGLDTDTASPTDADYVVYDDGMKQTPKLTLISRPQDPILVKSV